MKKSWLLLVPMLGIAALLPAQTNFVAYGHLGTTGMISVCWKPGTHYLKYSNLQLRAETGWSPNLNGLSGQYVKIEGTYTHDTKGDPICPFQVRVRKVTATTDRLEMPDRVTMGTPLKYSVYGLPGAFATIMIGPPLRTCNPLGSWGALFLNIMPPNGFLFIAGSGRILSGPLTASIPIPNVPVLQYQRFKFQAALVNLGPLVPTLLNLVDLQIR